jgi:hypothetical protein
MTNVIAFKLRRKQVSQPVEGPCQLLFFTGVRYMRQDEAVKLKRRKSRVMSRKNRA